MTRGLTTPVRGQVQSGVGAMQGQPAPAALDPVTECFLLGQAGADVAGIGDQELDVVEQADVGIPVVAAHADARIVVHSEQCEQLQPGEVEVVVLSAADQVHQHRRARRHRSRRAASTVAVRAHCSA